MRNRMLLHALAGMVAMGMGDASFSQRQRRIQSEQDEIEELNEKKEIIAARAQSIKHSRLTRFMIDGKEVWALNYKNAVRKAAKI